MALAEPFAPPGRVAAVPGRPSRPSSAGGQEPPSSPTVSPKRQTLGAQQPPMVCGMFPVTLRHSPRRPRRRCSTPQPDPAIGAGRASRSDGGAVLRHQAARRPRTDVAASGYGPPRPAPGRCDAPLVGTLARSGVQGRTPSCAGGRSPFLSVHDPFGQRSTLVRAGVDVAKDLRLVPYGTPQRSPARVLI